MSESAQIDYISSIDYTKGFQRFHVKWPLKDLTRPKYSSIFETTVIDGDQNINLSWVLGVNDSASCTWFGIRLKATGKMTPMIYRICLSSPTNVLFDRSGVVVVDGSLGYGLGIQSIDVDTYPIDDLMFHLWMDVPITIVGQNLLPSLARRSDVLELEHTQIFNSVVGTGPPDPYSDLSIIIVNKKDEELRRFKCHIGFLASKSDFFASGKWKENSVNDGRSVKINDVSGQVMETVLKYVYMSTLPEPSIDHGHLCGIIFAADKYNLQELIKWCVGVLIFKHDTTECRIEQLVLADQHNLAQLKAVCLAQLSLRFPTSSLDPATVKEISSDLWLEIMQAVTDRLVKTTHIILPKA